MLIVGLTGSIGMGKSTIAKAFADLGVLVWDADMAVHKLYQKNSSLIQELIYLFGDILEDKGNVDRVKLSEIVLSDEKKLKKLESIVHPQVKKHREDFISASLSEKAQIIILDIPLLFETNSQANFDKIIVVNCSYETQKKRVLSRKNMTEEKFKAILSKQMSPKEKVKLADFVINTDKPIDETINDVQQLHKKLLEIASSK